ncbi:MAG: periplasmic heavy metal sensor [Gammaproteobacteria bacterium]|nr:periplasmic heavy metal sensor [Gammaproteobacteria bacterium]MDH5692510.1 periplasmic heavy metal sensor [Gammaproteobacteria bacterium]
MFKQKILYVMVFSGSLAFFGQSFASGSGHSHDHGHSHGHDGDSHGGHHEGMDSAGGGMHWSKLISKEQKKEVDRMHHELDDALKPLKEAEAEKQKELNELTIKDGMDQAKINQAIDELMAIKNKILRHRYAHLTEMRHILDDAQRKSYDAAILKRHEIK